jgi:hypothetical protein
MRVEVVPVGSRIVDSLPFSQSGTEAQARALKATGVDGLVGYLGAMTATRLRYVLDAGLAFMPVTFAGEYKDGAADEIAQLRALGIPAGTTVWLDLEGLDPWNMGQTPSGLAQLTTLINTWARDIKGGGWMPGLYVGSPQPLTGEELYALGVVRYWLGIGRCVDRSGRDAYPRCGWCMRQDWHGQSNGMIWRNTGVLVDTNSVQCDHLGRLPSWVVGDAVESRTDDEDDEPTIVDAPVQPVADFRIVHPPVEHPRDSVDDVIRRNWPDDAA